MIITPELIEKASKAMHDAMGKWALTPKEYTPLARATLTAILPDIVETIAKGFDSEYLGYSDTLIAKAAIRALADKER